MMFRPPPPEAGASAGGQHRRRSRDRGRHGAWRAMTFPGAYRPSGSRSETLLVLEPPEALVAPEHREHVEDARR
jgi:hypothetical protein